MTEDDLGRRRERIEARRRSRPAKSGKRRRECGRRDKHGAQRDAGGEIKASRHKPRGKSESGLREGGKPEIKRTEKMRGIASGYGEIRLEKPKRRSAR